MFNREGNWYVKYAGRLSVKVTVKGEAVVQKQEGKK